MLLPHIAGPPGDPQALPGRAWTARRSSRSTSPRTGRTGFGPPRSSRPAPAAAAAAPSTYLVIDDLPTLIWAANLAGLELHVPMWRMPGIRRPDLLVFDLDPGRPANIVDCCRVAEDLRPLLEADGLAPLAKTSGGKGLQLYARISGLTSDAGQRAGPGASPNSSSAIIPPRRLADDQGPAHRQGAHRLEPEQRLQDHRRPLLAARPAAAHRLDPGQLGRGAGLPPAARTCSSPPTPPWTGCPLGDLFAPLLG